MISGKSIEIHESGVRLDAALLRAFPSTTRSFIRDAVGSGTVLVRSSAAAEARPAVKGMKLRTGSVIVVRELLEACDNLVALENLPPNAPFPAGICFADDSLLAFDKPAGMPVQPLSCRETGTLANAVAARYPECRAIGDSPLMAGALHRIDANTSGLVLVARTAEAFANLRAQFAEQTVEKTYLALVEGSVAAGGTLENDLVHDPTLPYCRMIDVHDRKVSSRKGDGGRPLRAMHAVTRFVPIAHTTEGNEERTLLEVTIHTGVTHQIRAQLAIAGMHIVNDRLYGAFAVEDQSWHCLHALAAAFKHPVSGCQTEIRTPLPPWARL